VTSDARKWEEEEFLYSRSKQDALFYKTRRLTSDVLWPTDKQQLTFPYETMMRERRRSVEQQQLSYFGRREEDEKEEHRKAFFLYFNQGKRYFARRALREATEQLEKALSIAEEQAMAAETRACFKWLGDASLLAGNFRRAREYHQRYEEKRKETGCASSSDDERWWVERARERLDEADWSAGAPRVKMEDIRDLIADVKRDPI